MACGESPPRGGRRGVQVAAEHDDRDRPRASQPERGGGAGRAGPRGPGVVEQQDRGARLSVPGAKRPGIGVAALPGLPAGGRGAPRAGSGTARPAPAADARRAGPGSSARRRRGWARGLRRAARRSARDHAGRPGAARAARRAPPGVRAVRLVPPQVRGVVAALGGVRDRRDDVGQQAGQALPVLVTLVAVGPGPGGAASAAALRTTRRPRGGGALSSGVRRATRPRSRCHAAGQPSCWACTAATLRRPADSRGAVCRHGAIGGSPRRRRHAPRPAPQQRPVHILVTGAKSEVTAAGLACGPRARSGRLTRQICVPGRALRNEPFHPPHDCPRTLSEIGG